MFSRERFNDRIDAGRRLAQALRGHEHDPNGVVLALVRGGVPVAYEVAHALRLPLDVMVVRKIGMPGQEEFALGAIASGGIRVLNPDAPMYLTSAAEMSAVEARAEAELQRREQLYRGRRVPPDLNGRTVILVDDGLATGATMRAAVEAVRQGGAARIVVAVPVGSERTCEALRREVDEVVCLLTPELFYSVGEWYRRFDQTTDDEVRMLLDEAWREQMGMAIPLSHDRKTGTQSDFR
jgi:predicted phosphoribosyltransferase